MTEQIESSVSATDLELHGTREAITVSPSSAGISVKILDDALTRSRMKLRRDLRDLEVEALLRMPAFLSYFQYDLACVVAESLAGMDPRIRAIYMFESEENTAVDIEKMSPESITAELLVHVECMHEGTKQFVASLNETLSAALREMSLRGVLQLASVLNCRWVTDDDIKRGVGDGILLNSLFAPPLQIWAQEG